MKKIIFLLLFLGFLTTEAQYKKPFFNTLNVLSGLPEANVQSCLQDKYGYIWLGTQNGLVRYDGYKIKSYPIPDDDGREIVNASVNGLYEDRNGNLWASSWTKGFYYYDRAKDVFVKQQWKSTLSNRTMTKVGLPFYWADDKQPGILWVGVQVPDGGMRFKILYIDTKKNTVEEYSATAKGKNHIPVYNTIDIRQSADKKIWITSDSLLSYFDESSKSFVPAFVLPDNPYGDFFESFKPDPTDPDLLWMNTYDIGIGSAPPRKSHPMKLIQYNTRTRQYKTFLPDPLSPGALPASTNLVFTDSLKRVWISTDKGLSLYNRKTGTFINYPISFFQKGLTPVLTADKEGNLWIGSNINNLVYLNTKSGLVTQYDNGLDEGDLNIVNGISNIFFDRSGILWINTPSAGISYLNSERSLFAPVPIKSTPLAAINPLSASYAIVGNMGDSICFLADSSNQYAWHIRTGRFDKIELKIKKANRIIQKIVAGKDGSFWIGTSGQGLINYDPLTRSTTEYRQIPGDSLSLSNDYVFDMVPDKEGIIWIGTNRGLCSFDHRTQKFTRYPYINNDATKKAVNVLDDSRAMCLFLDSEGILWVGTNLGGLNRYNIKTKTFTSFLDDKNGFSCVLSLFEDSRKRLWVSTYLSGLFLFDRKTETYKRYSEKDGMLSNNIQRVSEDAAGNIWAFTERGLSRLNPVTNTISNFTGTEFFNSVGTSFKSYDANFLFFTQTGLVSFDPMQLNNNPIAPSVVIESIHYRPANRNADTVLFAEGRQNITLAYNENKIDIKFVALHFADPSQNKYAYQLEGFDKDWVQAGAQHTAGYTNLPPGTYVFKVKAANSDGVWNETGASFTIIILPPWWKTWWAYLLYAAILIAVISFFIAYRSAALKRENKILEDKVARRTSQLNKSIEELKSAQSQLVQSEKMASLGELTAGIAHEIQNPLNFVNNFSEVNKELAEELKEELAAGNLQSAKEIAEDLQSNSEKINHHGKRADAIVKGMLQHSQSSKGQKEPTDINALADEYLRLAYHGLRAKDKSFNATLKTEFDETIGKTNIIPQDIGRVFLNLITNAFYAIEEKRKALSAALAPTAVGNKDLNFEPTVSIKTNKIENRVRITVSDNGNGIPKEILDKIFQPFFTTKPTGQGTGLGLSLAYDIVKAHGGELKVETIENESTTFIIHLPINQ